jgi:hypothetical protein
MEGAESGGFFGLLGGTVQGLSGAVIKPYRALDLKEAKGRNLAWAT